MIESTLIGHIAALQRSESWGCVGSSSSVVEFIQVPRPAFASGNTLPEQLIVKAIWSVCCEHKIILVEESDEAVGTGRQVVLRTSFKFVVSAELFLCIGNDR